MRLDKWAVTAQEALQAAVGIATDASAGQVQPVHLLKALLGSGERNLNAIIERVGADPASIEVQVDQAIARQPRVSGDASQMGAGADLVRVGDAAEKLASKMGDSYVTSEHLLCALADSKDEAGSILKAAGVTGKRVSQAYEELRAGEHVTSQDAKPQLKALEQYGRNVTDLARQGKLDPVIGRVEEIRRTIQVLSRRTKNNPVLIGAR
ncbi:MAG TPA: ATP-dependent chaperone ClpB, partial [Candidatus Olsenella excrementavium]|nr:ATP-dependent chaperone ClpB [Candidatus Olsenella excrementavium]